MSYTLDEIYNLVGRDDKVAVLTFYADSHAFNIYGESITGVFYYNKTERERFEKKYQEKISEDVCGDLKVRYLGIDLSSDKVKELQSEGINSKEIQTIFPSPWSHNNLYYQEEKRTLTTIEIPIRKEPKGGDYDWMYGFKRKLIKDGVQLFPYDFESYLGWKWFYEPDNISEEEKQLIFENNIIREPIEIHFLQVKSEKEIATPEEEKRFQELSIKKMNINLSILRKELTDTGTNITKLYQRNSELCEHLLYGTFLFIPQQLNGFEGKPIFLDWKGYLHIFIRHVDEFMVSEAFAKKDKFSWYPKDIIPVIKNVINSVDDEIQKYWEIYPDSRFSKYGNESLYFEGDYYTFHVEANGCLSTLHRSRKST